MRNRFTTRAIIAVALLAVVGGVAVVAWRTTYLDSILPPAVREFLGRGGAVPSSQGSAGTSSPSSDTSSEDSTATAEDPTKDWKTYTDTDYGFSFKYPSDWILYPNVTGGLIDKLGNLIIDLASSPKSGDLELVYPVSPVKLRVIYVAGEREGKSYESLEEFGRIMNSGDVGELYSDPLDYETFGGKTWVKVEVEEDYAPIFYTLGSNGNGYAIYVPKDVGDVDSQIVELVVSTVEFF